MPKRRASSSLAPDARAVERARASVTTRLFLMLALFNSNQAAFLQQAASCALGVCAASECWIPLVPHVPGCRNETRCVLHCDCYSLAAASQLQNSGVVLSGSGAGSAASSIASSSVPTTGASGMGASSPPVPRDYNDDASLEMDAHPADGARSQFDGDAHWCDGNDYDCHDFGGADVGDGGGDVSEIPLLALEPPDLMEIYFYELTHIDDFERSNGSKTPGLRGIRALSPSLFALRDFALDDDLDGVDVVSPLRLMNRVCHVLVHQVNLTGCDTDSSALPCPSFVLLCDCCEAHSNFIASKILVSKDQPFSSLEELQGFIRRYDGDVFEDGSFGKLSIEDCLHTAALRKVLCDPRYTLSPGCIKPDFVDYATFVVLSEQDNLPQVRVCFHSDLSFFSVLHCGRDRFPVIVSVHHGALRCSERRSCRNEDCIHVRAVKSVAASSPQDSPLALSASVSFRGSLHDNIDAQLQPQCQSFRPLPFNSAAPGLSHPHFGEAFLRTPRHLTQLVPDGACICLAADGAVAADGAITAGVASLGSDGSAATSVGVDSALSAGGILDSAPKHFCRSCRTHCPNGHDWAMKTVLVSSSAHVYTLDAGVLTGVAVFERHCSHAGCAHVLKYDGQQDGYLAVSSTVLWDLRALYLHAETLARTGATFNDLAVQMTALARQFPDQRNVTVDRGVVATAFWAFLSLLQHPPLEDQHCVLCGPPSEVPILGIDGTDIGTLAQLCNIDSDDRDDVEINSTPIKPADLYLFLCVELRALLKSWLLPSGLDKDDWQRLHELLAAHASFLSSLFQNPSRRCPEFMRPFVEVLASQSISYGLLCDPLKLQPLLSTLSIGIVFSQEHHQQLLWSMPELAVLLTGGVSPLAAIGHSVDLSVRPLLQALSASITRVMDLAAKQPDFDRLCERSPVSLNQDLASGRSFHPDLRRRFKYVPRFVRDSKTVSDLDELPASCQHKMSKPRKFAHVHIEWVCQHAVSYGSITVPQRESLKEVYLSSRERFGANTRLVLLYDFGCGLSRYMYYRDPAWALQQIVKIDRFHSAGHKNCSPAYTFKYNDSPGIKAINTSAMEQRNAQTARVGRQVRFMKGHHAVQYLAFMRAKQNAKTNEMLRSRRARLPKAFSATVGT